MRLPERYERPRRLGRGGMGEVWEVFDRELERTVALKRVLDQASPQAVALFLREMRVAARLQHPGILPVHDAGVLPDGDPYFTMPLVRGGTLEQRLGPAPDHDGPALHRQVELLRVVAQAVACAADEGVFHGDLKPGNVLVGRPGEVYVADWGLARVRGGTPVGGGTAGYLAPERARGEVVDEARAESWSLGRMLGRMLSAGAEPPVERVLPDVLRDTTLEAPPGAPTPPPLRGPAALVGLVADCTRLDPLERPAPAEVARRLTEWLDGTRRREEALRLLEEGRASIGAALLLQERARALSERAGRLLDGLPAGAPARRREASWAVADRAEALSRRARATEVLAVETLGAALRLDPSLVDAHAALADHHRARHAEAEARGDHDAADAAFARLGLHDVAERWARYRGGRGALSLRTDPPGAAAWLYPLVERHRRLVARRGAGGPVFLGHTPIDAVDVPHGEHVVLLHRPGSHPVRLPVVVPRDGLWDPHPPGEAAPAAVALPPLGALDPGDRYVPAGPFAAGGDPGCQDSLPAATIWVDGFVMRRHPVTVAEWFGWLQVLADAGDWEAVDRYGPATLRAGADRPTPLWRREGGRVLPAADDTLRGLHPTRPITGIDHAAALAWAASRAAATGLPWRLPHELEWVKAARGPAGRVFPWGARFDPSFTAMSQSFADRPDRVPVDAAWLRSDRSVYGVVGLAGNVRDWCRNDWLGARDPLPARLDPGEVGHGELRAVRGGAWLSTPPQCRGANRLAARPGDRTAVYGVRLVREARFRSG